MTPPTQKHREELAMRIFDETRGLSHVGFYHRVVEILANAFPEPQPEKEVMHDERPTAVIVTPARSTPTSLIEERDKLKIELEASNERPIFIKELQAANADCDRLAEALENALSAYMDAAQTDCGDEVTELIEAALDAHNERNGK